MVADGTSLHTYDGAVHAYRVGKTPSDIEGVFQQGITGAVLSRTVPLLDVLLSVRSYEAARQSLAQGQYVGLAEIDNAQHHHIKLPLGKVVLSVWVKAKGRPLVRRIALDWSDALRQAVGLNASAIETIEIDRWRLDQEVQADKFVFAAPPGAKLVSDSTWPAPSSIHPMVGQRAPDFELPLLDGGQMRLADHRGKDVVILDFWASWCGFCRKAMPLLRDIAERYEGQGVVLYAINERERPEQIRRFLKELRVGSTVAMDKYSRVSGLYQIQGLPHTTVIGKNGQVSSVHIGFGPGEEERISDNIDALIAGQDLICESLTLQPSRIGVGDRVTFSCVLRGIGRAIPQGRCRIAFAVDDQPMFMGLLTERIDPNEQVTYSVEPEIWHFQADLPGSHRFKVTADVDNWLGETDESNNIVEGTFTVAARSADPNAPGQP